MKRIVAVAAVTSAAFVVGIVSYLDAATATQQVTLDVTVNEVLSLSVDSATVSLGNITPGIPVTASTVATVTTNANGGYDLSVRRDDADTTLDKISDASVNIADKTAWDNTGNGNAATWSGTGLGFSVYASTATKNTTWWGTGTGCDDANNKYAGFPSSYQTIMSHNAYSASSTTTSICYKLDVPSTQQSGAYDGTITYQAVSKP